jgi:hypothetical protein
MTRHGRVYLIAVVLGVVITCVDLFADNGEISPAVVLLLLLIAGGAIGAIHSRFSLALAVLTAICFARDPLDAPSPGPQDDAPA